MTKLYACFNTFLGMYNSNSKSWFALNRDAVALLFELSEIIDHYSQSKV